MVAMRCLMLSAVLGDCLVLIGCVFYGISNVGQEHLVKNYDRFEYLGMVGLFGAIVSAIQMTILERSAINDVDWRGKDQCICWILFARFCVG